jgi:hypothetical protein
MYVPDVIEQTVHVQHVDVAVKIANQLTNVKINVLVTHVIGTP